MSEMVHKSHVALGPDADRQLASMIDAVRVTGGAGVVLDCDVATITVRCDGDRLVGECVESSIPSDEDDVALQILHWRPVGRDSRAREWRADTPSTSIADDVLRAAKFGYQTKSFEFHLALQEPRTVASTARATALR